MKAFCCCRWDDMKSESTNRALKSNFSVYSSQLVSPDLPDPVMLNESKAAQCQLSSTTCTTFLSPLVAVYPGDIISSLVATPTKTASPQNIGIRLCSQRPLCRRLPPPGPRKRHRMHKLLCSGARYLLKTRWLHLHGQSCLWPHNLFLIHVQRMHLPGHHDRTGQDGPI